MNIAIVTWDISIKGGTQRQALELANNLQALGHKIYFYTYYYHPENCYTDLCSNLHIKYIKKGDIPKINLLGKIKRLVIKNRELRALRNLLDLNHNHYDAILLNDYVYSMAAKIKGQKIIWMLNDMPRQFFLNKIKGPILIVFKIINKIIIKKETKNINKIIVLDKRVQHKMKRDYRIATEVVRSGVDINSYLSDETQKDYFQKPIKIFASGIFYPHRRFEDIVLAVSMLPSKIQQNIQVTINGRTDRNTKYYQYINNLINKKGLNSTIKISNGLSENELKEKYNQSHIFIFPNHQQTWGLAVFEAMLAGCLCIVSNTAGAHEVLTDKENALIIPAKSPRFLASSLEEIIQNPSVMEKMAKSGKDFVINNLSWEKYAKNMEQIIKIYENRN